MLYAVDRNAAFEADTHSAKSRSRFAGDRTPKLVDAAIEYGGGDRCSGFGRKGRVVNLEFYQCVLISREGKYGCGEIADSRPRNASVSNSAVPSDVVIPKPS